MSKRYMPLEMEHLLRDEARRKGTDFEKLKYDYQTDELEKLIDTSRAEDRARSAAEAAIKAAEVEAAAAKADFVAAHCERMFAAAINSRSNCIKVRLFSVFQSACERIALYDDDDYSPANKLCTLIARAEMWIEDEFFDAHRFQRAVAYAFSRSGFKDLSKLADALRFETEADNIRRLASKLAPQRQVRLDDEAMALTKKPCTTRRNTGRKQ